MDSAAAQPASVAIPKDQIRAIFEHAASHADEVCGVLLGRRLPRPRIARAFPGTNVHDTPGRHFLLDAATLLHADRAARDQGWEIVGFYHSHPGGVAVPSLQDRGDAWPRHLMLIVGGGGRLPRHLCAWLVVGRELQPLAITTAPSLGAG